MGCVICERAGPTCRHVVGLIAAATACCRMASCPYGSVSFVHTCEAYCGKGSAAWKDGISHSRSCRHTVGSSE
jgi:hypothetical protein